MPRSFVLVLLSLVAAVPALAQEDDTLALREQRARLEREQVEIEAQARQLETRLERVRADIAAIDRKIARTGRKDGPAAPADVAALGQSAAGVGLAEGWRELAGSWQAEALGGLAVRELRREGERLEESAAERRDELAEILSYVRELGLPSEDLERAASPEALDAAPSWREELLRIHLARAVGVFRLLRHFAGSAGEEGILQALDRERETTESRSRRRLQSYLIRIVRERSAAPDRADR